jgi:predicted Fe-S protein YdhL (DUF1289 family)
MTEDVSNETPSIDPDYVASPCISVCSMDKATGLCLGCLRTLKEIGAWRMAAPEQKRAIVAACEERAKSLPRRAADGKVLAPDHPKLARFKTS